MVNMPMYAVIHVILNKKSLYFMYTTSRNKKFYKSTTSTHVDNQSTGVKSHFENKK